MKKTLLSTACMMLVLTGQGIQAQPNDTVKVWEETITLPTYKMDPNDPNPAFFRNQSYQGASRVIQTAITEKKERKTAKKAGSIGTAVCKDGEGVWKNYVRFILLR